MRFSSVVTQILKAYLPVNILILCISVCFAFETWHYDTMRIYVTLDHLESAKLACIANISQFQILLLDLCDFTGVYDHIY